MSISEVIQASKIRTRPLPDRMLLRPAAALLIMGFALLAVGTQVLHPGSRTTLEATFAGYAASGDWAAIHLMEFGGMAIFLAGLLVLFLALNLSETTSRLVGILGAISAVVTLALSAVLYAVDGVALKQAVDAWASAPAAEKATSFAAAEAIRWVERGTSSYQDFMWGLALVLFGIVMVWTARVPRAIGYLMGLSGLAWLVLGWLIGTTGFTSATALPTYVQGICLPISSVWLLITAWRMPNLAEMAPESGQLATQTDPSSSSSATRDLAPGDDR